MKSYSQIMSAFASRLVELKVPVSMHADYRKWLRFYLDFCEKYGHDKYGAESVTYFMQKLEQKSQTDTQRKEASEALSLFFGIIPRAGEESKSGTTVLAESARPMAAKPVEAVAVANQSPRVGNGVHAYPRSAAVADHTMEGGGSPAGTQAGEEGCTAMTWQAAIDRMRVVMKTRHYSPDTLRSYTDYVKGLRQFLQGRDLYMLTTADVQRYLEDMAVRRRLAGSSQNVAFCAVLFLFRYVLRRELGDLSATVRAKRPVTVPTVLCREDVDLLIGCLEYPQNLIALLMYGCGVRIGEVLELRLKDLDFGTGMLTVRRGKGAKDRIVPLPETIAPALKAHIKRVGNLYRMDKDAGTGGVFLPEEMEHRSAKAAKELAWYWLFPARDITWVRATRERLRYHVHETRVHDAFSEALAKSGIPGRVTPHTMRHCYASHLLQAGYDIRQIQELLGHADIRTTMRYLHTIKAEMKKVRSPLDL